MEVGKLNAQARPQIGKSHVRKLRATGQIPGICYGVGMEPIAIALNPAELQKALDPQKGRNTLLRLHIEGLASGPTELPVMLKDTQRDLLRSRMLHADFVHVRTDRPVRVTVPIRLNGKSEGVKAGGTLHQVYRTMSVLCAPDRIPVYVDIDVTNLGIGQSIHVSDLTLVEGVTAALPGSTTLCVVTAPKAEKAAEAAVAGEGQAVAGEGEAKAAAPAKAAAKAAAPAKAAAKAAAPAKAAAKGK